MAYQKLSQRIAEESQLLAEERWIKEALAKIRNQRNCLQIERLHLESMKAQLRMECDRSQQEANEHSSQVPSILEPIEKSTQESLEFEEPIINEGFNEELNLDANCAFGNLMEREAFDIEEEEDDDIDCEDLVIDMNMFMNGKPAKWD